MCVAAATCPSGWKVEMGVQSSLVLSLWFWYQTYRPQWHRHNKTKPLIFLRKNSHLEKMFTNLLPPDRVFIQLFFETVKISKTSISQTCMCLLSISKQWMIHFFCTSDDFDLLNIWSKCPQHFKTHFLVRRIDQMINKIIYDITLLSFVSLLRPISLELQLNSCLVLLPSNFVWDRHMMVRNIFPCNWCILVTNGIFQ